MTESSQFSWQPEPDISQQQPLAAGLTTNTWSIWVMAVMPLLGIVTTVVTDPAGQVRHLIARTTQQLHDAQTGTIATPSLDITGSQVLSWVLALLITAVVIVLAISDQRSLRRRGVIRPFAWAWVFLNPTYFIGRHVVVRRRVHGSLAPLWVWIGATVINIAVVSTIIVPTFTAAIGSVNS